MLSLKLFSMVYVMRESHRCSKNRKRTYLAVWFLRICLMVM